MTRVAIVTEIPAPYRIPLFDALAERDDVSLSVLFLSASHKRRTFDVDPASWRFDGRILRGWHVAGERHWLVANLGVVRELRRARPDVIVLGGWNQPAFWQAAAYAKAARTPFVLWIESTARDLRSGSQALDRLKRALVTRAAGAIVPGLASVEYALGLGFSRERVAVAPNAVDQALFVHGVDEARADLPALRDRLGLTRTTFLYVGRFETEKGVDVLVEAAASVDADVVLAGYGSLRETLEARAPANVRIVGPFTPAELVPWYAAADAFVLPSRSDVWGMALAEAAAAALPLVATDVVGAAYDVIEPGANGLRVPAGDAKSLAAAIRGLAGDDALLRRGGVRSRALAQRLTPAAWAAAVACLSLRAATTRR